MYSQKVHHRLSPISELNFRHTFSAATFRQTEVLVLKHLRRTLSHDVAPLDSFTSTSSIAEEIWASFISMTSQRSGQSCLKKMQKHESIMCSFLLELCSNESPKTLQLVRNAAAHVLTRTRRTDRISPVEAASSLLQSRGPGSAGFPMMLLAPHSHTVINTCYWFNENILVRWKHSCCLETYWFTGKILLYWEHTGILGKTPVQWKHTGLLVIYWFSGNTDSLGTYWFTRSILVYWERYWFSGNILVYQEVTG